MEEDPKSSLLDYSSSSSQSDSKLHNILSQFNSPTSRLLIVQIAGMIAVLVIAWIIISTVLSLLNVWMIFAVVIALAAVVWFREMKSRQREIWILQGQCANCGYDLQGVPQLCPECGRDALQDEPVWRKTRRQLEEKLAAQNATAAPGPTRMPPVVPRPHTKPFDDEPIPLEGEEPQTH